MKILYIIGIISIIILASVSISLGRISIPLIEIIDYILGGFTVATTNQTILSLIRIPKTLSAISAGISLSVAGYLLQTLFRNPLASPSSMGISSGASLGVAFVMLTGFGGVTAITALHFLDVSIVVIASILGAFVTTIGILFLSLRISSVTTLLLVGFMIGTINLSIVGIWQYLTSPDQLQAYFLWSMGSLHFASMEQSMLLLGITVVSVIVVTLFSKQVTILSLGEDFSKSMGVNVKQIHLLILFLSSILAGSVTAFCGPIGFVGIIIPHIVRLLIKTNDSKKILPFLVIIGAAFLLCCDIITSLLSHSFPLPISLVTSIVGSPIVLWILLSNKFYSSLK